MIHEALKFCNEMVHHTIHPWAIETEEEFNFEEQLKRLAPVQLTFHNLYEISYDPTGSKQAYYKQCIENDSYQYLNEMDEEIQQLSSKVEISFYMEESINSLIKILNDANILFQSRKKDSYHNPDERYILDLLKHHLVWIYLELQDNYQPYLETPVLRSDEIYLTYFEEEEPIPEIIIGAIRPLENVKVKTETLSLVKSFTAIKDEVRPQTSKVYSYDQLVKDPEAFAKVEELIYREGIINEQYNFQASYGRNKLFATVYHQLINKGYFHPRVFPEKVKVRPSHILKFLDHRYQANVNKEFRMLANNHKDLQSRIAKIHWLDNLPSCS